MLYDLQSSVLSLLFGITIFVMPGATGHQWVWGCVMACVGINHWAAVTFGHAEWHKAACLIVAGAWTAVTLFFLTHHHYVVGMLSLSLIPFSVLRYIFLVRVLTR